MKSDDRSSSLPAPLRSRYWNPVPPTSMERLRCSWKSVHTRAVIEWSAPLFTRFGTDLPQSFASLPQSFASIAKHSIAWVGNASEGESDQGLAMARIAPIWNDRPVDYAEVNGVGGVEFQLYGVPFDSGPKSRLTAWAPSLPIEFERQEQFTQKVTLVRTLNAGQSLVGAAIVATPSVYDDVQFLIECGMDYVTLLADVQFGPRGDETLLLADANLALERAVRARKESHVDVASFPIFLGATPKNVGEIAQWLIAGAAAVCLDTYLISKRPATKSTSTESFGSFLGAYTTPTQSNTPWCDAAISELLQTLSDQLTFHGIDSMNQLLSVPTPPPQPLSPKRGEGS